jgi:UDP-glucose:(heptosyl)LPS alpha-1,3-glucosyltransferase
MKIALNIESIGARRGGAEKYAGMLVRWLRSLGHDVHVFASEVDDGEVPPGTPVHWVRPRRIAGLGTLRAYRFARASERALRQQPFDLIAGFVKVWYQHAYLAVGGAHPASLACSARRFRSPLLEALWWLSKLLNPKQWIFRAIARRQFHSGRAPLVIAPSRMVAEHFQRYHGVPADRIAVVYNALDAGETMSNAQSARAAFRRRHGLAADDVAVLFVARNYALKGLEPLLQAFGRIAHTAPEARLVVCGSRRDRRYRRQARRLGVADRVAFLGFVDDVRECFAGCDVFAFPTFYDPCSLVVLEAMNAGLPVITTRQNGAGELLAEGRDGFVVDSPWALDELAGRLAQLVGDAALRRRMGAAARANARAFTIEARQRELLAALQRAAAEAVAEPTVRRAA